MENFNAVVISPTNSNHISRFLYKGIGVLDWQQSLDKMYFDPAKLTLSKLAEKLEKLKLPEGEEVFLSAEDLEAIKKGERPSETNMSLLYPDLQSALSQIEIDFEDLVLIRRRDFGQ